MRLAPVLLACLLLAGCAVPRAGAPLPGALWALERFEQERAVFRMSDAERADAANTFERSVADATLGSERVRLERLLVDCPGTARQPFGLSSFDRVRDGARVQAVDDEPRLAVLSSLAVADWHLRRARATGEERFCDTARLALAGLPVPSARSGLIDRVLTQSVTVARDPAQPGAVLESASDTLALSAYGVGWTDAVRTNGPRAEYLAAVYGGVVASGLQRPGLGGRSPEDIVDGCAAAYPAYEPDALYAALAQDGAR